MFIQTLYYQVVLGYKLQEIWKSCVTSQKKEPYQLNFKMKTKNGLKLHTLSLKAKLSQTKTVFSYL